tara:strand:+ start:418 stop:714 length:297 start_codon:yes stop_codon:yes gene_type:complete
MNESAKRREPDIPNESMPEREPDTANESYIEREPVAMNEPTIKREPWVMSEIIKTPPLPEAVRERLIREASNHLSRMKPNEKSLRALCHAFLAKHVVK